MFAAETTILEFPGRPNELKVPTGMPQVLLHPPASSSAKFHGYSAQRWTWFGSIHGLGWVEILENNLGRVGLGRLNHVNFISVIVAIVTVIVRLDCFVTVCTAAYVIL